MKKRKQTKPKAKTKARGLGEIKNIILATTASVLFVVAGGLALDLYIPPSPFEATVMVTNLTKRSGGSGVIMSSSAHSSKILTNAHVCSVLDKGGYIKTVDDKEYMVANFVTDNLHDLCLVEVIADLHVSTDLASEKAQDFDHAIISGHPALLPVVDSYGAFSKPEVIDIIVSARECTLREQQDPLTSPVCDFFNAIPTMKKFESRVVTATIQGGSSGSAVYNADGDLSGLVFAGRGRGLSYAYIVPYSYVSNFLAREATMEKLDDLGYRRGVWPNYKQELVQMSTTKKVTRRQMAEKCSKSKDKKHYSVKRICSLLKLSMDLELR